MSRENTIPHKIAILATGDEIANGDIMNSNSQEIALRLTNMGMNVRMHMAAPDTLHELEQAIAFLLQSHDALIITGGLGPTSDDLTRFALSKVLGLSLVFDEQTWDNICARLKRFGYEAPPESNRQQALFPVGASIIPNANGTAAGCLIHHKQHIITMLPGPPKECLPMLEDQVLTELVTAGFQHVSYHKKWLLFGASEGKIAEELDLLAKPFDCVTGYRLFYPYIEFKLHSNNLADFEKLLPILEKAIHPYLIGNGTLPASRLLRHVLTDGHFVLDIYDHATDGALEALIKSPKTRDYLYFYHARDLLPKKNISIEIEGLTEYWQEKPNVPYTHLEMIFTCAAQQKKVNVDIPFRGIRVIQYATEFICSQIYEYLELKKA